MGDRSVLLLENSLVDFVGSRLSYALFLKDKGYLVYAFVPHGELVSEIERCGILVISYKYNRNAISLFQLVQQVIDLVDAVKKHNISIVHSFRFYPNLLNVIQRMLIRNNVIIHVTGLGIVFSRGGFKYMVKRIFSQLIFQFKFFLSDIVIFQNDSDPKDIWFSKLWHQKVRIIHGSGIDTEKYDRTRFDVSLLKQRYNLRMDDVVFLCTTRLIWEKGIKELVEAFIVLNNYNPSILLLIVGEIDIRNPSAVSQDYIDSHNGKNGVRFLGHRKDVLELLAVADVFIYPSYYREGIPRSILEALSMSLPVITTDMPGCRTTVASGKNGIIIRPKSMEEIVNSVTILLNECSLSEFGRCSRQMALDKFASRNIYLSFSKNYYL